MTSFTSPIRRRAGLRLLAGGLCLAAAGLASAQSTQTQTPSQTPAPAPRRIAVISLLGNTIHVVMQTSVTGTHMDRNGRESFVVPGNLFDLAALGAANEALLQADPKAAVIPLKLPSAEMFGDTGKLFEADKFVMPTALAPVLKQVSASHLLVITPLRAPTRVRTLRETMGSGSLEGLGYYLDYQSAMRGGDKDERRIGFLAPYTYFKLRLVDAATGAVLGERPVAIAESMMTRRPEGIADPWEALTSIEKVTVLRDQLTERVKAAVPVLLAQP